MYHTALRYSLGLGWLGAAIAVHAVVHKVVDPHASYLVYIAAVCLTAGFAGPGPAGLVLVLGALSAEFLFHRAAFDSTHFVGLVLYGLAGIAGVIACARVRRVQERRARESQIEAVKRVSWALGHDLKNAFGVIRNAVYLLRRRTADVEGAGNLLSMIDHEVETANTIVTNVMEAFHESQPQKTEVDLGDLIQDVVDEIDSAGRVEWGRHLPHDPCLVWCDSGQFHTVLHNVFRNALQAMSGKGEVMIAVRETRDHHCIEVRDTGSGIAPAIRPHLFEPLATTKKSAAGLGLFQCRRIMSRHGGTITEDESAGPPGALFRILLPRRPDGSRTDQQPAPSDER